MATPNHDFVERPEFPSLVCSNTPLLDVRAPIEFERSHLPTSCNRPLLSDDERAKVGTCYKTQGKSAAVQLGHQLVSGSTKEHRVLQWRQVLQPSKNPVLYCARGGLRSQIAQQWLAAEQTPTRRVRGGYKALRNFLLEAIEDLAPRLPLLLLSGKTGSGKTRLLHRLARNGIPCLDLEQLANHRGSAFGELGQQPYQATFENRIAVELLRLKQSAAACVIVENESQSIGRAWLPASLFQAMKQAPLVLLECQFEERVTTIIKEYIVCLEQQLHGAGCLDARSEIERRFQGSLGKLQKRLGGLRCRHIQQSLAAAMEQYRQGDPPAVHEAWVAELLNAYYDPCYSQHLALRSKDIVFRGNSTSVAQYIETTVANAYAGTHPRSL